MKLNSAPSNIDQTKVWARALVGDISVSFLSQNLRCKILESPFSPWQLLSAQFPNVWFSTNVGCILFTNHVVISHSPFCQLRGKKMCRPANAGNRTGEFSKKVMLNARRAMQSDHYSNRTFDTNYLCKYIYSNFSRLRSQIGASRLRRRRQNRRLAPHTPRACANPGAHARTHARASVSAPGGAGAPAC